MATSLIIYLVDDKDASLLVHCDDGAGSGSSSSLDDLDSLVNHDLSVLSIRRGSD